ncbi:hypothetical protein L486_00790 [Kwoniella mangroviensis CBS 10435]|uniref:Uncharacterized protein n=1 Tax=Kwoniella mangroviensis CBS 10435 TaxID=1331196 RepID=A0A1B9J039_9TREE|nr:hypothetical protein L486_00790 [Kwoniella mangroviensis CBS 10435]
MFCRTLADVNATTSYRTSMQISNISQNDQDKSFQFDINSITSTNPSSKSRSEVDCNPPESEIQSSSLMEGDESGLSTQIIFGERYIFSAFNVPYNGGIPMYDLHPVSNNGESRERWDKGDISQVVFNNDFATEISTFVNTNADTSNSTNVQGDPSYIHTPTNTSTNESESGRVTVEGWMFCKSESALQEQQSQLGTRASKGGKSWSRPFRKMDDVCSKVSTSRYNHVKGFGSG